MTAPLPDDDLLALIEGELAPERIERIRTVLMRDPALLRRLEAMQRDRALMQRVEAGWRASSAIDDPRLISDAVEQAERDALLHEGGARRPGAARHRGHHRARRLTMVASIVLGAGLLSVWSWLLIGNTKPAPPTQVVSKLPPADSGPALTLGSMEVAELAGPPALTNAVASATPSIPPPSDDDITDAWLRSAGMVGVDDPDPVADATPPHAPAGMSIAQAARLALEGRLKLVTDRPPGSVVRAMAADSSTAPLAGPALDLAAITAGSATREITLRIAPAPDAQAEMERELSQTIQRLALSTGASIRFAEINRPATPPAPSMTFDDIIWWSRPTSEWRQRIEVRVPVELASDAPTP